jgi:hypothetical protein
MLHIENYPFHQTLQLKYSGSISNNWAFLAVLYTAGSRERAGFDGTYGGVEGHAAVE